MATVGERIKDRREELDISQVELAERINIKKQTLFKYEKNIITNIPSDVIERIANELSITPPYLMGWEEKQSAIITFEFQKIVKRHKTDIAFHNLLSMIVDASPEQIEKLISMYEVMYDKEPIVQEQIIDIRTQLKKQEPNNETIAAKTTKGKQPSEEDMAENLSKLDDDDE